MEGSQALVVRSSAEVAQLDELDSILRSGEWETEVVDDPEQISRQIIEELLAAEDDDALLSAGEAVGWREYAVPAAQAKRGAGTVMEVSGFRWRPSTFEEGGPIFFVVQATDLETGEALVLTCGSWNVMAQLSNLARRGRLPGARVVLTSADSPTAAGFRPLRLSRPFDKDGKPLASHRDDVPAQAA